METDMPLDATADSPPAADQTTKPYVEVRNLNVRFVSRDSRANAVNGVTFSLCAGEVLCVIGESGSGKSVTMRALMKMLPEGKSLIEGHLRVGEHIVSEMTDRQMRAIRGAEVSMIFQEPMTALDPVCTIGQQIAETIMRHEGCSRKAADERALELLRVVRIPSPERRLKAYPHELSGGLRQRAMIAIALSCRPRLLLADEPTTALDATVQAQVLVLMRKLQRELGMAMIFVTHDLGVAAQIADKVAVMYAGRMVEYGPVADVLNAPRHPYTRAMLASNVHGHKRGEDLDTIPGSPPDMRRPITGCAFAPRCKVARPTCAIEPPPVVNLGSDRYFACVAVEDPAASPPPA
jgi:peptide/nickel transport system ATP-binding protein